MANWASSVDIGIDALEVNLLTYKLVRQSDMVSAVAAAAAAAGRRANN